MFEFLFKYPTAAFARGSFVFLAPWPVWALALLVLAIAGALFWRMRQSASLLNRARTLAIWAMQTTLIALILLLLWRPALSIATLRPQQNIVAVVVDASRSMAVHDDAPTSRYEQAASILKGGLIDDLSKKFQVRLYRMGADAQRTSVSQLSSAPDAPVTRIGESLKQIAAESASLPVGAVVLLSDGAENAGGLDYETIQKLRQQRIPVHTVGFGATTLARDIELEDFSVPQRALAGSRVEATVTLRQSGLGGEKARLSIRDGNEVLASQSIDLSRGGEAQVVPLVFNAGTEGARNLTARVDPIEGEQNTANNSLNRVVNVSGHRPRILYVEGEPRWEYKFLRRAADDDKQIDLVSMLRTTPNKLYRQGVRDAKELEQGFPTKVEELFAYDALIIGSIESNWFTPSQQEMIREFAGRRGGGVLFLGGRFALADGGYASSPIAELLPVRLPLRKQTFDRTFSTASLTPAGSESALCRLIDDPQKNIERWKTIPQIANWQDVGEAKPGAVTLLEVTPPNSRRSPLLVTENFGRGRAAVLASAGFWRVQMHLPHDDRTLVTFWRQMLRWIAADTRGQVVASTPKQIVEDETLIRVRAEVRDKTYQPVSNANVDAHFIGPAGVSDTLRLNPAPGEEGVYIGEWNAAAPGAYLAEVVSTAPDGSSSRDVVTFRRDDGVAENFRTTQNRALLQRLSEQTGGRYYTPSQARGLSSAIAYSEAGITTHEMLDLWDMPIVFLLALGLRGSEWLLRRKWGVV